MLGIGLSVLETFSSVLLHSQILAVTAYMCYRGGLSLCVFFFLTPTPHWGRLLLLDIV